MVGETSFDYDVNKHMSLSESDPLHRAVAALDLIKCDELLKANPELINQLDSVNALPPIFYLVIRFMKMHVRQRRRRNTAEQIDAQPIKDPIKEQAIVAMAKLLLRFNTELVFELRALIPVMALDCDTFLVPDPSLTIGRVTVFDFFPEQKSDECIGLISSAVWKKLVAIKNLETQEAYSLKKILFLGLAKHLPQDVLAIQECVKLLKSCKLVEKDEMDVIYKLVNEKQLSFVEGDDEAAPLTPYISVMISLYHELFVFYERTNSDCLRAAVCADQLAQFLEHFDSDDIAPLKLEPIKSYAEKAVENYAKYAKSNDISDDNFFSKLWGRLRVIYSALHYKELAKKCLIEEMIYLADSHYDYFAILWDYCAVNDMDYRIFKQFWWVISESGEEEAQILVELLSSALDTYGKFNSMFDARYYRLFVVLLDECLFSSDLGPELNSRLEAMKMSIITKVFPIPTLKQMCLDRVSVSPESSLKCIVVPRVQFHAYQQFFINANCSAIPAATPKSGKDEKLKRLREGDNPHDAEKNDMLPKIAKSDDKDTQIVRLAAT